MDPDTGWAVHALQYVTAEQVQAAIASALGTSGAVSVVGEHQIMITGSADQVRKYSSMVRALSCGLRDVERIPVKHLRVSTAIERLKADNSQAKLIPIPWGHAVIAQGTPAERVN